MFQDLELSLNLPKLLSDALAYGTSAAKSGSKKFSAARRSGSERPILKIVGLFEDISSL